MKRCGIEDADFRIALLCLYVARSVHIDLLAVCGECPALALVLEFAFFANVAKAKTKPIWFLGGGHADMCGRSGNRIRRRCRRASRSASCAMEEGNTLMATSRSSRVSLAR
jgi:hypothetical protein